MDGWMGWMWMDGWMGWIVRCHALPEPHATRYLSTNLSTRVPRAWLAAVRRYVDCLAAGQGARDAA